MPPHGSKRRITLLDNDRTCIDVQVAKGSAIDQAAKCAELRRQIDVVEADVTLVNPVDHPHGGGEGKSPIGHPGPLTPWGKPALGYKTRAHHNRSDKFIVKRRNGK